MGLFATYLVFGALLWFALFIHNEAVTDFQKQFLNVPAFLAFILFYPLIIIIYGMD